MEKWSSVWMKKYKCHGINIVEFWSSSPSSYCNPVLLSSTTEEDRDRIYGWTLDTGHWPATRRHLRRSSSSHRSNTITIKLQQWHEPSQLLAKSSPNFFQHQHGRRAPYQSRHSPLSILHQKHIHCTLNHQPPENYATWRNFIFFLWFDPDFVDLWQPHP